MPPPPLEQLSSRYGIPTERIRQIIRQAEQVEVAALLQRDDLETLRPQRAPLHSAPAGRVAHGTERGDGPGRAGVERPPQGITQADWERVLDARR